MAELQQTHQFNIKIEGLWSESIMAQTLAQAREKICIEISEDITKIFPSIETIF